MLGVSQVLQISPIVRHQILKVIRVDIYLGILPRHHPKMRVLGGSQELQISPIVRHLVLKVIRVDIYMRISPHHHPKIEVLGVSQELQISPIVRCLILKFIREFPFGSKNIFGGKSGLVGCTLELKDWKKTTCSYFKNM